MLVWGVGILLFLPFLILCQSGTKSPDKQTVRQSKSANVYQHSQQMLERWRWKRCWKVSTPFRVQHAFAHEQTYYYVKNVNVQTGLWYYPSSEKKTPNSAQTARICSLGKKNKKKTGWQSKLILSLESQSHTKITTVHTTAMQITMNFTFKLSRGRILYISMTWFLMSSHQQKLFVCLFLILGSVGGSRETLLVNNPK